MIETVRMKIFGVSVEIHESMYDVDISDPESEIVIFDNKGDLTIFISIFHEGVILAKYKIENGETLYFHVKDFQNYFKMVELEFLVDPSVFKFQISSIFKMFDASFIYRIEPSKLR